MLEDECISLISTGPTHSSSDDEGEDTMKPVQDQPTSSKRQRETQSIIGDGSDGGTQGNIVTQDLEDRLQKRVRYSSIEVDYPHSRRPPYTILHIVRCNGRLPGHEEHPGQAWYSDQPRLFEGDNKASWLRGLNVLPVGEDPETPFLVRRTYYCHDYHIAIAKKFVKLHLFEIPLKLQPYSYRLPTEEEGPRPIQEVLEVQSEQLQRILTARSLPVPLMMNPQNKKSIWLTPYLHLYHIRSRVRKLCSESGMEADRQLVEPLFLYIEDRFGSEYTEAEADFARGNVSRVHFHKLFGPDDVIVIPGGDHPRAVKSRAHLGLNHFDVQFSCFSWEFDGVFRRNYENIIVQWPDKEKEIVPIASLGAFPLRYDTSGLKHRLSRRGQSFWRCRYRQFVTYASADEQADYANSIATSRYMIDMSTYNYLYSKDNEEGDKKIDELAKGVMQNEDPPDEEFTLLLPAKIRGFHMEDKKWRLLNIEQINDIEWNKQAFQRLVLDHDKRKMIEALVTIHITAPADSDIIEGKGNGLIILLHGPPGTGKTLTAESVAELAERPLYRVTCGDIGTDADSVEAYLKSVFYLGNMWKAVVLLDESDIFLEERTPADLQRNALVSVFLRALEYYDGILILTSNRVGLFDEAFKSRVQLALYYPPLKEESRWAIWNGFFTDLQDRGINMEWDEIRIKIGVLARHKLNGRQIRNSIRSARQLAQFEKDRLRYSHLERTIKLVVEFENYVVRAHGHTDNEYIRATRARCDGDSDDSS